MVAKLTLPAPAKLNLFLHITAQREDGYHLLQTVFQLLDYSDEITLEIRQDGKIIRNESNKNFNALDQIPLESDLCVRAAKLLQSHTNSKFGVEITLDKKLPIGGGIGGGSSDAATVLLGLNELWGCQLTIQELTELGLKLGADVPVFIHGHSAWGEGIGEQLTPINLPESWFLVIQPDISVSTAEIFADQGLTRDCDALTIARFLNDGVFTKQSNVFEIVVKKKYPKIANALEWLTSFSEARLTGTGSCIFAKFKSEDEANQVLDALAKSPNNWQGFVAKGVNQSPLHNAIAALQKT
ncbi:4-(cytidine 5'-diphospho)-2-C-methyl-D-erythritol kinase [Cocleimonas sp. KMM 6892]|uniref:4-(cytidine 5'-diphospho)-2-C-methyl-D-erythritol kinase n=1 Tax=unclassified Cocleimonas TaxID=2639732 RepID=UPI002DBCD6B2|nr:MULTISPECIES: 4-(cytidine 5'-diphospho)-2-C-methyl-D-erythritol kinase [unclassified Cocleimonas]MEB8433842.1 4-(cytidine 5'-diphospho)-2-C-methyl-D-erythritol kinase [Cocleimonas sp. KMM 6892]MEC4716653.1 4-(cytidine 5'-diphospho)-2-C-methyl-D-erythritol kinase [Cocleimonas sp. KMM 6895]MEC4746192.1 4-(cytidine 5'-diphospho)-2-C-methyl-D-erythritol kinase [Cocleimonas sp. KMM 6896]